MAKPKPEFCDRCGARCDSLTDTYDQDDGCVLLCPSCVQDEKALHDDID